ncbi:MAG TPA: ATP-binding protein [Chitinophagaceae bacterium]
MNLNHVKILIIDDDEDDFFITSDYINNIETTSFKIEWCYNYQEALDRMKQQLYDLYFVDYRLGAKTGLDLLTEAINHHCEEPIVLLTGKGNQAIDKMAMRIGAADYLVKTELSTEKLERCIRYSLERYASLKALKANERKYRTMFEHSKDAVFVADEALCFKDVNDATCDLTGFSRNELFEMSLNDLLDGEQDIKKTINENLLLKGEIFDLEISIHSKGGGKRNCILSAAKETDAGGSYVQGIIHDITHIRKSQKATLQAEKLAAAGRLVRTLAHEVRNPLNNINLSVEQLIHETDLNTINTYLEIIERNSKRIGDLITELLNSSRPTEMKLERTLLQGIMDETISIALDRITLRRIKLKIKYDDKPDYIIADKEKLKIAFLNIILNAIEAMEEGRGLLEIAIEHAPGNYIVKITDNGTGVSEENLSRLFEPYFTSKRNGLGLGLASTLNIIQSHKAKIEVTSTLNVGTKFTIIFPVL